MQATEQIVESITEAIAQRQLAPGTKLTEHKLCQQFGVSRTLVRQALNQLSRHQVVTLLPGRGAFVAKPSTQQAQQIFEVRAILEKELVGQLAKNITAAQIAALKSHLALEEQALRNSDIEQRTELLGQFHAMLARMHGNAVLTQILSDLLLQCSLIALAHQTGQSATQSHAEHVQLVQALQARDAKTAVRLMSSHLDHIRHSLKQPDSITVPCC